MAALARNKQGPRRQAKNTSGYPKTCEYGELLYGHKRKASLNSSYDDSSCSRITRSKGSKSAKKLSTDSPKEASESQPSKIPRLSKNNHTKKNSILLPRNGVCGVEDRDSYCSADLSVPPSPQSVLQSVGIGSDLTGRVRSVDPSLNASSSKAPGEKEGDPLRQLERIQLSEETQTDMSDHSGILATLDTINQRLKKLDKLDDLSSSLPGKINEVKSQVGEIGIQVNSVKSDLNRYEEKWEAGTSAMLGRIGEVERGVQALEQKCESKNSGIINELASVKSSAEQNTSRVSQLEADLAELREKWKSLGDLEQKIKNSAEDKFQELQVSLKTEVHKEMKSTQSSSEREIRYEMMKGKAFNKRHNIVVFGLAETSSPEEDLKSVSTFFSERMNLRKLDLEVVYRLGAVGARPRPLVVRFKDIQERWAVWNKRKKIKYVKGSPVWLQEDLPKRLREDYRVLQRIAKTARTCPEKYTDIMVKDYKISINGIKYDSDHFHKLPSELSPAMVYTPCSENACVFFTKYSPFSNHFSSAFNIEGFKFSCIEQYLAVQKAHLADNKDLAREAMSSSDPERKSQTSGRRGPLTSSKEQ